jgi:hypothetical protein
LTFVDFKITSRYKSESAKAPGYKPVNEGGVDTAQKGRPTVQPKTVDPIVPGTIEKRTLPSVTRNQKLIKGDWSRGTQNSELMSRTRDEPI